MLPNESKHYIRVIICIFRKLWRSCECGAINGPNGKWMCCSLILLFWDLCLVLSLTPTICFFRLTFLVAMDILNSRREMMLRRLFFTWMVYAFYPMLILSFLLKSKWPTSSSKNLSRVKLTEMLLSWDSLFNHAKGLHHLWKLRPLLQKEMLPRLKKVLAVLKRMPSSVLGNVSFWSFETI